MSKNYLPVYSKTDPSPQHYAVKQMMLFEEGDFGELSVIFERQIISPDNGVIRDMDYWTVVDEEEGQNTQELFGQVLTDIHYHWLAHHTDAARVGEADPLLDWTMSLNVMSTTFVENTIDSVLSGLKINELTQAGYHGVVATVLFTDLTYENQSPEDVQDLLSNNSGIVLQIGLHKMVDGVQTEFLIFEQRFVPRFE